MRWVCGLCAVAALILLGCVEENPALTPSTTVSPSPVPEAAVAIVNETTVKVRWKPSPSENSPAFKEYYLVLTEIGAQTVVRRLSVTQRQPEYLLTLGGLRPGVLYGLDIWVRFADNSLSPVPRTLLFAAAPQYTELAGQPIRLYEQAADPSLPNGLNFNIGGLPAVLDRNAVQQWDICFEIVGDTARIGPAADGRFWKSAWGEGRPATALLGSNTIPDVTALDEVWVTSLLDTVAGLLRPVMLEVPQQLPSGKGLVFFVWRATDATWAKVLIKPGPDGRLIQGSAPNRYVELAFSYQKESGVASALPSRRAYAPDKPGRVGFEK
ncbi:hypothetical protein HRbin21_01407 [bacterium HR21]|nr:hypothetical protein HRbin21_01407 [bacterium HR21]